MHGRRSGSGAFDADVARAHAVLTIAVLSILPTAPAFALAARAAAPHLLERDAPDAAQSARAPAAAPRDGAGGRAEGAVEEASV